MHLAFGITCADRTPTYRIGNVLRAGRLQKLRRGRQSFIKHTEQGVAGQQQTFLDIAGAVDVRIVDQTLPTDRGARLLEVHAHHNQQFTAQLVLQSGKTAGVIKRSRRIVHGTGADNHQQTVVLAIQASANLIARIGDDLLGLFAQRQLPQHLSRGGQHFEFKHTAVHDAADADLILPTWHVRGD